MTTRMFLPVLGVAVFGTVCSAQTSSRQATMRGGGNPNEGKCTIEVVVDGAAQVEIRGNSAQLTNLKGQPAQWRRFECNGVMPSNPVGFRFEGVDGRGRQQLVREPRNGSPAVVEIEDSDNGSEGYTFDIIWGQGGQGGYIPDRGPQGFPRGGGPDFGRGQGRGNFSAEQAVAVCQDSIRQQASDRFRTSDIRFRQTAIDNNPGRSDWVNGTVEVHGNRQPDQVIRFSCSVDFQSGRVRSASLMDPVDGPGGGYRGGGPDRGVNAQVIENCERAAQDKVQSQGFDRVTLGSSRFETDRGPRVVGDLRAYGRNGAQPFRFSCSVNPRDGDVRSVDVFPGDRSR